MTTNKTAPAALRFILVRDFAGVRNNRASSPYDRFGDANRAAMKACADLGKTIRVFALTGPASEPKAELVAEYTRGPNGGVVSVPVA